jgi:glycerol transport system ATP-binding protein
VELFERPRHTFVGHFIGSPGMNLLPCEVDDAGIARVAGHAVATTARGRRAAAGQRTEIGVRPEFVTFADSGLPVRVERILDAGRHRIVESRHDKLLIKALVAEGASMPAESGHVAFDPEYTMLYADDWLVEAA